MKNKALVLIALCSVLVLNACKKDGTKPTTPASTASDPTPLTTAQLLVGKWLIVKDSVQTFDFKTQISNFQGKLVFGNSDFVEFKENNSGDVSSQVGFDALYIDFGRLVINPGGPGTIPNLNFKYQVSPSVASLPPTLFIPNITPIAGITYSITNLNANSLVLHYETNIAKYPHDYLIKEDIHLSK